MAFERMKMNQSEQIEQEFQQIESTLPKDDQEFKPLLTDELLSILGLTVKRDTENKLISFLCELSAYTEDSQFNISFNAPSSTGKSYIPTEIARLFPPDDVMEISYCSPTAFFHDCGQYIKEKNGYVVNLERKIVIFLDQPHFQLLERLRSLLSHDKKEIQLKITDKSQKGGLKTKNIFLVGFPSVIFCTAGLRLDEQESTRFLLLSPETNQEKIREAISQKITKESDTESFKTWLDENPERQLLKERILAIKDAQIREIQIENPELIKTMFFERNKILKPRHQRDIGRIISLVKSLALLNLWFRDHIEGAIKANETDIQEAFRVWDIISESQELNLPPYIYNLFKEVILPQWNEKNSDLLSGGLSRQEILNKYFQVYGRPLADWLLRQQIIPMLETSGLITQEADLNDKRKMLIYPTNPMILPSNKNNSESDGGVEKNIEEIFGIEKEKND
jgi:hypothetical protein